MSKEKKLLYNIKVCYDNGQNLHLGNGIVLNFSDMTIVPEKIDYKIKDEVNLNEVLQKHGFKYCGNYNRGDGWYRIIKSLDCNDKDNMRQAVLVHGDWDNRKISFKFPYRDNVKRRSIEPYILDLIEAGLVEQSALASVTTIKLTNKEC